MNSCYALALVMACARIAFGQTTDPAACFQSGPVFFSANFDSLNIYGAPDPGEIVNDYYFRYLQCATIPNARTRSELEQKGLQFLSYLPEKIYLIAIPFDFDLASLSALQPKSLVQIQPDWKIASSLQELPYGDWAVHGDRVDVDVQVYPVLSIGQGAARCRAFGCTVLKEGNQNGFLKIRLRQSEVQRLAAEPWVQYLELAPEPDVPDDTRSRSMIRANMLDSEHPQGLKYNGEGVRVLVRDDGPIGPHIDFAGRLNNQPDLDDNGIHGDGVAGVMAGAGNIDPTAKGMAPGATVYSVRYTADFQDQTLALHTDQNITITNTSYSSGCNAGYTLAAQTVDQQLYNHPTLMHVFSAGNSNGAINCTSYGAGNQWGNITGGHKMAKNAIVAANTGPDGTIIGSSSRGPATDGRLKPDIASHGTDQETTDDNNGYYVFGGTSAAAPGIAGLLAQLTHAYKSLNNGQQPEAALLKAAMLNTANDLGNTGPDFKYGWGHANAWRALQLFQQNRWMNGSADQGGQFNAGIQVPSGMRQARIMICWTDPPAAANVSRALVNDLDLKVQGPDGTIYLPWKLNSAPNAVTLDQPAGKGRDSLNNVEQVVINDPQEGAYTVLVDGTEVPFGPQSFFLVWTFLDDEARLTYPAGGEGFVPGEVERLRWDAFGNQGIFSLRYSIDDGFSWQQIADVAGDLRNFDWKIPEVVSGRVRLMIQRGFSSHVTELPLSIVPVPDLLQVEQVCPNSMTISWMPVKDTLPSDVYLLGNKYMQIVGTAAGNTYTFPIQNGGTEKWVSVRARNGNGMAGRRAWALRWPGELKNCIQPDDLALRVLNSPEAGPKYRCGAFTIPVSVQVKNEGTNPVSGAVLNYQVGNQQPVSEILPALSPGNTIPFTFQTPISVTQNGQIDLKIWSTYAPEDAPFNDTLRRTFQVVAQPENTYFTEDFEDVVFPPFGWVAGSNDGSYSWAKTTPTLTGADGMPTRSTVYYYYYNAIKEGFIDVFPVDLAGISQPGLSFQIAHPKGDSAVANLRVEVYPACDPAATPVVIWQKTDPALATIPGVNGPLYAPSNSEDWRTEAVSLSQFSGQKIKIRFVASNSKFAVPGNNIYLDNIGIVQYNVTTPVAQFESMPDSICLSDEVSYEASLTGGDFTNYEWFFGITAQPASASGQGPHAVKFLTAGNKQVHLVVSNTIGSDTIVKQTVVWGKPVPEFSAQTDSLTAIFQNNSQQAKAYSWEFGDGNGSSDKNPVHTYAEAGDYSVKLTATSECGTTSKMQLLSLSTDVQDVLHNTTDVRIVPNPNSGQFDLVVRGISAGNIALRMWDSRGRMIRSEERRILSDDEMLPCVYADLPAGVYHLQLLGASLNRMLRVVIE
ncbi:MAG: S8 family serine peptidase [Lewinellaceae bacterium]|nr:S8 family serine peptidase [Lewinellaceae bacterium]